MAKQYDTVIGLEVHIQLNTQTKAFCGDALSFGAKANTHVSAISLAHPGTMPVVNVVQIDKAIQLGLALGCEISPYHYFDRKHYFYPDLPKAYQITQDNAPICIGGALDITVNGQKKTIRLHHIHMEEDAGKTIHDQDPNYSLVDLNRAGTPLLELVTEPDLSSGDEVYAFMTELQKLLRYIDVSDADMEKGSMRCDCNVSIKPKGSTTLGERCEIKNLNSRRFAKEAVEYEVVRQINIIESGATINRQTLHYNTTKKITQQLRDKEGAEDYRYFPDPDLPPMRITEAHIERIKKNMPPMPWELRPTLSQQYGLNAEHVEQLLINPANYRYFEKLVNAGIEPKTSANFLINQLLPQVSTEDKDLSNIPVSTQTVIDYLTLIQEDKVSHSIGHQRLWPALIRQGDTDVLQLAEKLGVLIQEDNNLLDEIIDQVFESNPSQLKKLQGGKKNLVGFFMGQIMRQAQGASFDPKTVQKRIMQKANQ